MGQLSFFSAEARQPCVADLAGLLCGPGRAVGFARGRAARISVGLAERWRGVALVAALAERGVDAKLAVVERPRPGEDEPPEQPVVDVHPDEEDVHPDVEYDPEDAFTDASPVGTGEGSPERVEPEPTPEPAPPRVRVVERELEVATAFRTDLRGLAGQWLAGDAKVVPPDLALHGGVLRLWALAAGRWAESAYVLGLDPDAPGTHEPLRVALAGSGLPATLLTTGGPALKVVGRRRLERLAELVGRPPRGVLERTWPAA
ncbi:hypothetical protein [Saccharothrix obliqua]|uniref:hypothetical protein n=1 Tax=Saccharothrix obliqua TaxID=2861747 RepID=UPI001C5F6409|nr:hypothetical protein [Saccharothrix obliqua]MBW4719815.1 hypothetical protein [Saccharothrix obliqua]